MTKLTIATVGGLLLAAATATTAPASTGGGRYMSPPAAIAAIDCRSGCADARTARPGSLLRVKGQRMKGVRTVTFLGGPGDRDDVTVPVEQTTPRSLIVRVPATAQPGRLRTRNADGSPSRPSAVALRLGEPEAPVAEEAESLTPAVADRDTSDRIDAHVDTSTVFFAASRSATLRFVVVGDTPLEVAVELVRTADGKSVQRWTPGAVPPGQAQRIVWDGELDGAAAPEGRYEFRVSPIAATAAQDAPGEPPLVVDSFRFLDHKFPVRGKHHFGEEIARFGAGRGGHAHQGHDVFAACGTPLVAARGGTVRWKASHGRAGNYVVINGEGTDVDYAYMHLQAPALVDKGDRVATGQRIGAVGDTGAASGCHLHFELWTGPGWYEGGKPFDPLASLRAWDAQS